MKSIRSEVEESADLTYPCEQLLCAELDSAECELVQIRAVNSLSLSRIFLCESSMS